MPTVYKVLGQTEPSITTATTLYTVPASTSTIVSSLSICNRATTDATFRISIRPAGAAQADQHYLAFDAPVVAKDTVILTVGITLATTDVITVYSSNADTAFQAFGSEIS
jgi:hypothetical protein